MRRAELFILPVVLVFVGCEANFRDLRPEDTIDRSVDDAGASTGDTAREDSGPSGTDSGVGSEVDAGSDGGDVGSPDDTSESDTGSSGGDAGDRLVAEGTFEPRDYDAEGTAQLYQLADGSWEVRLGSDFQVESTPGPVVVLTSRETMGSDIKPNEGDKELGTLRSDSGADQYEVPGGPGSRRNVFIFCKPFGGEIGRAIMEAP